MLGICKVCLCRLSCHLSIVTDDGGGCDDNSDR